MNTKCLLLMFLVALSISSHAQEADSIPEKDETEIGVSEGDFPKNALRLLEDVSRVDKFKYYKKDSLGAEVYVAKFKVKGEQYTVLFDVKGVLNWVEVNIGQKEIEPSDSRQAIMGYFDQRFKRTKVMEIKKLFLPKGSGLEIDTVIEAFSDGKDMSFCTIKYMVEVSGDIGDGAAKLYEVTFNEAGEYEKIESVEMHNMDNIIF
ncbi:PepSY-like domain-containing protein [Echinicola vietnamensis]|nr:PepSY-like domain-containing protein [Echinicola vietnamensis]